MPAPAMKYNPAFLTEQELVDSFVVRQADLHICMRTVRDNTGPSNQHVLIVGARGMGKTTLALRVAAEVRRTPELAERWHPVVFGEESYQVGSPGELWLEALFHLARQTQSGEWGQAYTDLKEEPDEYRLRERALAQLMDFADSRGKRLLLVVENFNMLLGDQLSDEDAWTLRHTLTNEPRLMLVTSATKRFEEIDSYGKAFFDLFRTHELKPLDTGECATLWSAIADEETTEFRVRPIEILTGGNPRLVRILGQFGARKSLRALMSDLTRLVDEHTEYFKSHLDGLAATERKAYLALAEIWEPATAKEVALAARLDVSKTSALLNRLVDRGAVSVVDQKGRKKSYQVSERMYNIYYLMRRRGGPSGRVQAAVNFITGMYSNPTEDLAPVIENLIQEMCGSNRELSAECRYALEALLQKLPNSSETRRRILEIMPVAATRSSVARETADDWHKNVAQEVPKEREYARGFQQVVPAFAHSMLPWARREAEIDPEKADYRHTLACILCAAGKPEEAIEHAAAYLRDRDLIQKKPDDATELFVAFAAAGHAREGLHLLIESPSGEFLEPLIVALQMEAGEEIKAPVEIVEVAKDIVKRIDERRKENHATATP